MVVSVMTEKQFARELEYQASLSIVEAMKRAGLIDCADYEKWQQRLIEIYDPPIGRIVSNREDNLLIRP